ncbi:MAG: CDP-alcohol phosphatidyltransferase family protein [Hyphomicrobiales bacterium]|nr:CDP-alcohol phosphatidyltransferase family protein [Hyphomicrobiales bacterium]
MAPVIVAFALSGNRTLFVIFLCISFATDILDGFIARVWDLCTEIGSRLDSIADVLTYAAALTGIFQFEYPAIKPHVAMLYAFIGALILATLIPLIKFKRSPSFHLYSFKANALFQGLFIFCLFIFGFNVYFYYAVMSFGILACLEAITVALLLDHPISDAKGLWWMLDKYKSRP